MKSLSLRHVVPFLIVMLVCLGMTNCVKPSNEPDGPDNPADTTSVEPADTTRSARFYTFDLTDVVDIYDKLVFKDADHYMLASYYDDGAIKMETFEFEGKRLGVCFNEKGFPSVAYDENNYIVLGGYKGNEFRCGLLNRDGTTETVTLTTDDVNWDEYEQLLGSLAETRGTRLGDNQKENIENAALKSVVEAFLNYAITKKTLLGEGSSWVFLVEVLAYCISDDEIWLDTVKLGGRIGEVMVSIGSSNPITGLIVTNAGVWYEEVFYPLYEGGYFLDPEDDESPYGRDIEYLYKSVYGVSFSPGSGEFSWYGGNFEIDVVVNGANFDLKDLEWQIVSTQPEWLYAIEKQDGERHYLYLSVYPNFDSDGPASPREHTIVAKLVNVYEETDAFSFTVHQGTKLRTNPQSLVFEKPETQYVAVESNEDWTIQGWPSWCEVNRQGLYGFSVKLNEDVHNVEGDIILKVKSVSTFSNIEYEVKVPVKVKGMTTCPDGNHPHMIDLGLPSGLKWACCNVGASSPEGYGNYYAWGETSPKGVYNFDAYKYGNTGNDSNGNWWANITKYNTYSGYGPVDNKTVLDLSDDAARANWGGSWRMATIEEWRELINSCTWTWTTQNGVYGGKLVGPNGGTVFFPAAGYRYATSLYDAGSYGNYWSSSLRADDPIIAWRVLFYSGDVLVWSGYSRYDGRSVRPVCRP